MKWLILRIVRICLAINTLHAMDFPRLRLSLKNVATVLQESPLEFDRPFIQSSIETQRPRWPILECNWRNSRRSDRNASEKRRATCSRFVAVVEYKAVEYEADI